MSEIESTNHLETQGMLQGQSTQIRRVQLSTIRPPMSQRRILHPLR